MLQYLLIKKASQRVLNELLSLQGSRMGLNRRPGGLGLGYMAQRRLDGSGAKTLKAAALKMKKQGLLTPAEYKIAVETINKRCRRR